MSCGARIPVSHLRGANAGALSGSEVNDREYWGGIAALQETGPTPILWNLIDRLMETGQIRKVNDYQIVWPSGFELDEVAKATIEYQLAQAHNLQTAWCTIDEIRAEEGKLPLPEGAGKVVLGLKAPPPPPPSTQTGTDAKASNGSGAESSDSAYLWLAKRFRRKKKQ